MTNFLRPTAFATLMLTGAVAATLLIVCDSATARERRTSVTGPNGQTATRDVARSRGDVQSSTTLPNGKTSSRSVDRSASGTTATVTGPNGKSATRQTTFQK